MFSPAHDTSQNRFHIAVVGGGLIGKSAALLCAQLGLRVALLAPLPIVTASPAVSEWDSRIYAFSRSSQALLAQLRIWPALDAQRVQPVQAMRVFGDGAGELEFSAYQAALGELAWIVEQRHVEHALDAALRFTPQVTQFPVQAKALEITAQCAQLGLADGRQLEAECVLGADGARSWVREHLGIACHEHPYGQLGVVANFAQEKPHHGTAYQWFMGNADTRASEAGDILALLPLPNGHVSMVWSAHERRAQALLAMSPEALCEAVQGALGGAVGQVTGTLRCVTAAQGFPLIQRQTQEWVRPRVALLGDAAHVIHPLAGQGMNLGLRDVAELGRVFAAKESFRDYGDFKLLRRYARARQGDAWLMGSTMRGLHGLFAQDDVALQTLRNQGMKLVSRLPGLKQMLVRQALG